MVDDQPELYIFRPAAGADDWRAERDPQREASRRLHLDRVRAVLAVADACTGDPRARAEAVLDGIFLSRDRESDEPCPCTCHPHLPATDLHGYGADCQCRRTAEERRAGWDAFAAERDAFWESPEGREIRARQAAEEAELVAWAEADPGLTVASHGGLAPEQWWGTVDGHSFYFRERHDEWRIELDLAPCGRFVELWTGADPDDETARRFKEIEEGEVIAEGATRVGGYGETPLGRGQFIVETIRTHLRRLDCTVHTTERDGLELLLGRPLDWCPACGRRT